MENIKNIKKMRKINNKMKHIITMLLILTSVILTSQVRFDYVKWIEDDEKEDSTGYVYYTSDPDTVLTNEQGLKSSVIYYFDNEGETVRFIPVYRIKITKEKVVYFGRYKEAFYKMTYNKKYGDFVIKERVLLPKNKYTMFFHRDYDYYNKFINK